MSPPLSFSRRDQAEFQRRLDAVTGTRDGKPIIKLAWAPGELRWYPHRMGEQAPGYIFPIFYYGNDADGNKIAAPRWVLLERLEPEQYASTWEAGRYSVYDGSVWDWRGPCPSERYVELRAHCHHDGNCCPCRGSICNCMGEFEHCWGLYVEPNAELLEWATKRFRESLADPEVKPTQDVQSFSAPQSQRNTVTRQQHAAAKEEAEAEDFESQLLDFWRRKPVSSNGLRRTPAGIILLN